MKYKFIDCFFLNLNNFMYNLLKYNTMFIQIKEAKKYIYIYISI